MTYEEYRDKLAEISPNIVPPEVDVYFAYIDPVITAIEAERDNARLTLDAMRLMLRIENEERH